MSIWFFQLSLLIRRQVERINSLAQSADGTKQQWDRDKDSEEDLETYSNQRLIFTDNTFLNKLRLRDRSRLNF